MKPCLSRVIRAVKQLTLRGTFLTLSLLVVQGCDSEGRALGTWELAAIDGVGMRAAVPLRIAVPEGTYGQVVLEEGQMWKEYNLALLALELLPGGVFREQTLEATASAVSRSTYDRPNYAGMFGGELIREDVLPGEHEVNGTWTLEGDSLALFVARTTAVSNAVAHLVEVMPNSPESDIQTTLDQALPLDMPLRWSGTLRADRLELRDSEGREFTFRKVQ